MCTVQVLHEVAQTFSDGRVRERRIPLSEKILPQESAVQAAHRGICEELGAILLPDPNISVQADSLSVTTSIEESISYPGLQTQVCLCLRVSVDGCT